MQTIETEHCTFLMEPQPKATLLHATPEWVVAQATKGYTQHYSSEPLSQAEIDQFWWELGETKLKGPLEMAQTFWLIEDVTRAFTHQLARYRLGTSMVQESQRFSRQTGRLARIVVPFNVVHNSLALEEFMDKAEQAMVAYEIMANTPGVQVQDARGILPTNICTRLYLSVNLSSLRHIYSQRYCCQTQDSGRHENGEWKQVVRQMKDELILRGFPHYAGVLEAPWEEPTCVSCGFGASFDRPCSYQSFFDANLKELRQQRLR